MDGEAAAALPASPLAAAPTSALAAGRPSMQDCVKELPFIMYANMKIWAQTHVGFEIGVQIAIANAIFVWS